MADDLISGNPRPGRQQFLQTGRSKDCYRQMKANPKVEICAMAQDGRWIRVTADAKLVGDTDAAEHMLNAYPSLRAMYTPGDGNTAVFALESGRAVIASFTAKPVVITF